MQFQTVMNSSVLFAQCSTRLSHGEIFGQTAQRLSLFNSVFVFCVLFRK